MIQKEKKEMFDLSEGDDNFILNSSNNILKVSSGIKLFNDNQSLLSAESSRTRYTISATIDEIKKTLASVRSNDEGIDDRVYYYQAYDFQKLGLYKREDVPTFKIKLNDLPEDIIYELSTFDESTRRFVLKQAVSRIFEDINYDLYHDSISSRLEVSLVD